MTIWNEWSDMVPSDLKSAIQSNHQTLATFHDEFVPSTYIKNPRTGIGVPLLRHAHTLAYSIGFLLQHEFVAPGFALFRPLFESYARGIWLLRCANDKELRQAYKDDFPNLSRVVKAISDGEFENADWFSEVFDLNKKPMHSLTHGGTRLIMLLYADDTEKVEPDYPVEEQIRLMKFVDDVTLGAAAELREHLNKTDGRSEI